MARGVCVDALNPAGRPSLKRLQNLGVDSVRMELRDDVDFYCYMKELFWLKQVLLLGPSTDVDLLPDILDRLPHQPDIVIIGNEPDGTGPSSWTMTSYQYVNLWNYTAPLIRESNPNTLLCAAGLVNGPNFLQQCWNQLTPRPHLVNKHYPNDHAEIQHFSSVFNVPVIVGEWCWRTGSQAEILVWQRMLSVVAHSSFWFCWSDDMVPNMGLVHGAAYHQAYYRYRDALLHS